MQYVIYRSINDPRIITCLGVLLGLNLTTMGGAGMGGDFPDSDTEDSKDTASKPPQRHSKPTSNQSEDSNSKTEKPAHNSQVITSVIGTGQESVINAYVIHRFHISLVFRLSCLDNAIMIMYRERLLTCDTICTVFEVFSLCVNLLDIPVAAKHDDLHSLSCVFSFIFIENHT